MHYRPVAFIKLLATSIVGIILVVGAGLFGLNRMLDLDFRRLGYVNLAVEVPDRSRPAVAHAQVWVMSPEVRFQDVRLRTEIETIGGTMRQEEFARWEAPGQMGDMEEISIPLERGSRQLTTCLIVPSGALHRTYRVTQKFALIPGNDGVRVAETEEKRVSREDGSPCGVRS
jgi:hypothetical protein